MENVNEELIKVISNSAAVASSGDPLDKQSALMVLNATMFIFNKIMPMIEELQNQNVLLASISSTTLQLLEASIRGEKVDSQAVKEVGRNIKRLH